MGEDDEKVGYCKPPKKHQFAKGRSGNPKGRPKKQVQPPVQTSDREILKRLDAETLESGGQQISKRELELRILQAKALKGDLRAMKMLDDKRSALKLDEPVQRGGVLVVEKIPTAEEWAARAKANQAKYREKDYSPLAEMGLAPVKKNE